jgi:hypothetical protein
MEIVCGTTTALLIFSYVESDDGAWHKYAQGQGCPMNFPHMERGVESRYLQDVARTQSKNCYTTHSRNRVGACLVVSFSLLLIGRNNVRATVTSARTNAIARTGNAENRFLQSVCCPLSFVSACLARRFPRQQPLLQLFKASSFKLQALSFKLQCSTFNCTHDKFQHLPRHFEDNLRSGEVRLVQVSESAILRSPATPFSVHSLRRRHSLGITLAVT